MPLRVALGQFNARVGDLLGNLERMLGLCAEAKKKAADIIVFPELAVCGYPPEDLLFKKHFQIDNRIAVEALAKKSPDLTIAVGFAEGPDGKCFNSLAILQGGKIAHIYRKCLLPNYGVFDERRYFQQGTEPVSLDIKGVRIVLTICEDLWDAEWLGNFFTGIEKKQLIINASSSPFHVGKIQARCRMLAKAAQKLNCAIAYCNLVGGQDELVFDGQSMFLDSAGKVAVKAKAFEEDLLIADIELDGKAVKVVPASEGSKSLSALEEVYKALVLGTRDYTLKNNFKKVVIGMSGGIDSSLTAAIAVLALGSENVIGITMPSEFNSSETICDAELTAKNLKMGFLTIPIGPILDTFDKTLGSVKGWDNKGIAYENLQARIRGKILMSLSNQFDWLVLTTGNKSETAVGYSTLYGDTAGGFAVIKDVPKTMVYELCGYINSINGEEIIPQSVIERTPSAELRPNQKDSDSLPEYELLDKILKGYVEEDKSARQLVGEGLPKDVVNRVIRMVDRNEYKRRQSPPGVKITPKAFGRDRRLPITNFYTSQYNE